MLHVTCYTLPDLHQAIVGNGSSAGGVLEDLKRVICHPSHVTRHTSHVTHYHLVNDAGILGEHVANERITQRTSRITRHTSHVTRHASHVTHHTSHVTHDLPLNRQQLRRVRCRCPNQPLKSQPIPQMKPLPRNIPSRAWVHPLPALRQRSHVTPWRLLLLLLHGLPQLRTRPLPPPLHLLPISRARRHVRHTPPGQSCG